MLFYTYYKKHQFPKFISRLVDLAETYAQIQKKIPTQVFMFSSTCKCSLSDFNFDVQIISMSSLQ